MGIRSNNYLKSEGGFGGSDFFKYLNDILETGNDNYYWKFSYIIGRR